MKERGSKSHLIAFGEIDAASRQQIERCLEAAGESSRGVLCADHHKGYSMPIGGVVASAQVVMPAGVGYDIACGNCAVQTPLKAADVDVKRVMDQIWRTISFGMGRNNDERIAEHPVFDAIAKSPVKEQRKLLALARGQLGTVGGGNHYVDLFEDRADGSLWVGVHFGSRGLGHKTASGFLALAAGKSWDQRPNDSMDAPPAVIPLGTPRADDYLAAMNIAGEYAYAGRDWVVDRVLKILQSNATQRVHNHHNFAWWETHHGRRTLVVRKGATPAFPGQKGFIGGSMGGDAVIVEGVDAPASKEALYSTVHGAGRVMSRTQAAGKMNRRTGKSITRGVVNWPKWQYELKERGIELRGGGADEAPECYKDLKQVLAAHGDTIKILHTLRPIGVAMAGKDTIDPYRD
jgi:tRNA-splicing ligase RtcB (3'-phosphate/5'-hydroxy nucleic acid ligase)